MSVRSEHASTISTLRSMLNGETRMTKLFKLTQLEKVVHKHPAYGRANTWLQRHRLANIAEMFKQISEETP